MHDIAFIKFRIKGVWRVLEFSQGTLERVQTRVFIKGFKQEDLRKIRQDWRLGSSSLGIDFIQL